MVTARDSQVLQKLAAIETEAGRLPAPLEFYRRLLRIQAEAWPHVSAVRVSPGREAVRTHMEAGKPLLRFDDLSLDMEVFGKTFRAILLLFADYADTTEAVIGLGKTFAGFTQLEAAARAWFHYRPMPAIPDEVDDVLFEFALGAAMRPFLVARSEAMLPLIDQEQWRRGYCPICGGQADFAFLEKHQGARWLLCSRCDAEWLFQRLGCPRCSSHDESASAYFTDESGLYRLYVCEHCRAYLKAIDLRRSEGEVLLTLERFLTLDLDAQACRDGYKITSCA